MIEKPLAGRIALVTGASRGIGFATALKLAEAGAHIVAVARTLGGLEELDDAIRAATGGDSDPATLVPLDLDDFDGIARLALALNERYQRLDVFVGNAGLLGPVSPLGHVEPKDFERVMRINVTANLQFIRCMDPLLRRSDAGRVVFVSSGVVHKGRAYVGPYSISKAALEVLARTYAAETVTTPVRVMLVNPGATRTRMRAAFMPGEDPETLPPPERVANAILSLCLPGFSDTGKLFDVPTGKLMEFRKPA